MSNDVSVNSKWLYKEVKPKVEMLLKDLPAAKYATLYIAQYYNDQASDEVHAKVLLSKEPLPDDFDIYGEKYKSVAYFGGWLNKANRSQRIKEFNHSGFGYLGIDVNYDMIESLQPYCSADGDQGRDFMENYVPFARWTIMDGAVLQEDVSQVMRPWLVGALREEDDD
jgi:hypothetical protein